MLALVPLVSLLANVAKVDIRAGGTLTSDAILAGLLKTAYAGAGLDVPTEHMTVMHAAMAGSYVIEVDAATPSVRDQLDGYWCQNDPALRNAFKDLVGQTGITGLTDVTDVHTCVGPRGEGCPSSTPCGAGDVDDDGTPDPAPEPTPDQGGGGDDDGGGNKLSTVAIVFIVLGALVVVGILVYLLWPWIETCWKPGPETMKQPMVSASTGASAGAELPPLYPAI